MKVVRFDRRVIAYIIDFIISMALSFGVFYFIYKFSQLPILSYFYILTVLFQILIYSFINTLMLFFSGTTIGSAIMRIKVIPLHKEKLTFRICLIRCLSLSVFVATLINALYMLTVHTEMTIFDRLSQTMVIDARNNS